MRVDDTFSLNNQWIAGRRAVNRIVGHGPEINADLIRSVECRSAFHNAELSDDERRFVEEQIAEGNVDVVFATSSLAAGRSEEHTSELQSLLCISYAVFCFNKKR